MTSRRGFTLLELMIIVLILGVLVAIAVPNFIAARENSRRKSCISSLRLLDSAKEQWAMETKAAAGSPVTMSDLASGNYLRGPVTGPKCPGGGTYTLRAIGETPLCNQSSHILP